MSSCITRSEAVWFSNDVKSREGLDEVVYAVIGNNSEKNAKEISNGLPKTISKIVVDYLEDYPCFGESDWTRLCGRVDPAPALPESFSAIWNGPCPIFPEKSLGETHMLVYLPALIDGMPLTINKLGDIAKRYFPENDYGYKYYAPAIYGELGNIPIDKSYWVLMTKDVIPESRNATYAQQQKIVAQLAENSLGYRIPKTIEAAVCILAQYFTDLKTRLFNDNPITYTRCYEGARDAQVTVGGFNLTGLALGRCRNSILNNDIGVAVLRKL